MEIGTEELDRRQADYKAAVDAWNRAIQHEEDLASVEHSVADLDLWEQAGFQEEEARRKTRDAKRSMKTGFGPSSSASTKNRHGSEASSSA